MIGEAARLLLTDGGWGLKGREDPQEHTKSVSGCSCCMATLSVMVLVLVLMLIISLTKNPRGGVIQSFHLPLMISFFECGLFGDELLIEWNHITIFWRSIW